jgi:predicted DNA-binding protein (UPF0278 family)
MKQMIKRYDELYATWNFKYFVSYDNKREDPDKFVEKTLQRQGLCQEVLVHHNTYVDDDTEKKYNLSKAPLSIIHQVVENDRKKVERIAKRIASL